MVLASENQPMRIFTAPDDYKWLLILIDTYMSIMKHMTEANKCYSRITNAPGISK